jgi:DNA-binding MurR/RpiR family transcriptional regulator
MTNAVEHAWSGRFAGLPLLQQIAQRAAGMPLAQRRMAQAVLANPFRASTLSIDEFARAVGGSGVLGVSIATANRFAVALGFAGYAQFRSELAKAFESTLAPVERLRSGLQHSANSLQAMGAALEEDLRNLDSTLQSLQAEPCERAVDMILKAERVFTLGLGASAYLAGMLHHELDAHCHSVAALSQIGGASHAGRQIFKMGPQDLMIVIALPRYVQDVVLLVAMARERGVQVLAITDGADSPLVPLADVVLYVHARRQMSSTSNAAALALIEALCVAVARRSDHPIERAQELARFVMPWLHIKGARRPGMSQSLAMAADAPLAPQSSTRKKSPAAAGGGAPEPTSPQKERKAS